MGLFNFKKKENTKAPAFKATIINEPDEQEHTENSVSSIKVPEVIPIEERIKDMQPNCDGLYPHEILILYFAPSFYTSGNTLGNTWWYRYGIKDVQGILDSLEQKGYIKPGTIKDAVMSEKVPVIKAELQKYNLNSTGKKEILAQTLVDNVSEEELSHAFPKRPFILTDSGDELLKKYAWIPYIHQHSIEDLNIWNLTDMMQESHSTRYRDSIWRYLNDRSLKHAENGDYGLYRNCRLEMSDFLMQEGRIKGAFDLLCEVCAYDLSDLPNGFNINYVNHDYIESRFKSLFPYKKSSATVPPGIIKKIKECQSKLEWSCETLEKNLREQFERLENDIMLFKIFSVDECVGIVMNEINGEKSSVAKIYDIAEHRFKEKYNVE